ncbi:MULTISPECIES: hypothetical protein [Burkholderia cepacia complex]|uniref:hypothetical protein n=1 Tax=Burkholderia cepacia complex TaxID=87882 RepID=UPI001903F4BC|nr:MULTISPECIES: hypothetical protein [Burkholderia cepacia complex]MBJ9695726.1 hypothetical protein [Burkholderia cenocepacia]MDN7913718.1 hypothetical protein [Burkholderia cepacia]
MPIFFIGALLDRFARFLDRLHERRPVAAYFAALAIAALCTLVIALLNQDGTSVAQHLVRKA